VKNVNIAEDVPSIMRRGVLVGLHFFLAVLIIITLLLPSSIYAENSPPTLTRANVTPRTGRPNIEYLFTVTYVDPENDVPTKISVYIDQIEYEMVELNPDDTDYADGKDYFVTTVLGEGSYIFYYTTNDGNGSSYTTDSYTLSVSWEVGHYDIIHFIEQDVVPQLMILLVIIFVLVLVFCVISIILVLQLKKIAKGLEGKEGEEKED
jgi:hypothetical protein